jgi:hypothetical protein
MIDKNGYSYNDFLSDSSDDSPKYADGIPVSDCSHEIVDAIKIKQVDDDMNYAEAYNGEHDYYQFDETDDQPFHAQPPSNIVALDNVLSLAEEQVMIMNAWDVEKVIADDSILAVRAMLDIMKAGANLTTKEASNIALAQDQDNT